MPKLSLRQERDEEICRRITAELQRYKHVRCSYICMSRLVNYVITSTAPRFYISELRAARVIRAFLSDKINYPTQEQPLRMHADLFRTFLNLREKNPHATFSQLVADAVYSPAPSFYLSLKQGLGLVRLALNTSGIEFRGAIYSGLRLRRIKWLTESRAMKFKVI